MVEVRCCGLSRPLGCLGSVHSYAVSGNSYRAAAKKNVSTIPLLHLFREIIQSENLINSTYVATWIPIVVMWVRGIHADGDPVEIIGF
ncbi:hypothetical protein MLPF_0921 [Mycobacterium lepromatosis]|nr:hypothetical protein MLPF_0921 [Mycobacterium lepromatosis]